MQPSLTIVNAVAPPPFSPSPTVTSSVPVYTFDIWAEPSGNVENLESVIWSSWIQTTSHPKKSLNAKNHTGNVVDICLITCIYILFLFSFQRSHLIRVKTVKNKLAGNKEMEREEWGLGWRGVLVIFFPFQFFWKYALFTYALSNCIWWNEGGEGWWYCTPH